MVKLFEIDAGGEAFLHLQTSERFAFHRDYLEALWARYEPFAPNNFQKNLSSETYDQILSRIWEMLLSVILLNNGYTLIKKGLPESDRPDICIQEDNLRIWIECVMPRKPEMPEPDTVMHFGHASTFSTWRGSVEEMVTPDILSITGSLQQKKKQYERWSKRNRFDVNDIFVLAVNGQNLGFSTDPHLGTPFYAGFYPVGDTVVNFSTGAIGYKQRREVKKKSGAFVSQEIFLQQENAFYAGMLYMDRLPPFSSLERELELVFINNVMSKVASSSLFKRVATIHAASIVDDRMQFDLLQKKTL